MRDAPKPPARVRMKERCDPRLPIPASHGGSFGVCLWGIDGRATRPWYAVTQASAGTCTGHDLTS